MIFYHRTTEEKWKLILEDGVLWGGDTYHKTNGKEGYRYTYLAPYDWGESYGDVLLEVDYDPLGNQNKIDNKIIDNYGFNPPPGQICIQFSVFIPISINKIKRII